MPTYSLSLQSWTYASAPGGTLTWVNPGNAETQDGVYAVTNPAESSPSTSDYLVGTDPSSFSPGGNEVLFDLVATVYRQGVGEGGTVEDEYVYLWSAGAALTGINKAATGSAWRSTDGTTTYTWSASDLATLGVSLATMQSSGFGFAIAVSLTTPTLLLAKVDSVTFQVNTSYQALSSSANNVLPGYGVI